MAPLPTNAPLAYLNGRYVPAAEAVIPVTDAGFVQGVTVSEQLRTFGGKLFALDEHLQRLRSSLEIVGVTLTPTWDELRAAAEKLAAHNRALLADGDDLGLTIVVTPGIYLTYRDPIAADSVPPGPTLCLHTYPLPFGLWADKYERGEALATTSIQQVPAACWPKHIKVRSRLHYYLADRQAAAHDPPARALLLDAAGHITETSTANVLVCRRGEGLLSPRYDSILRGISLGCLPKLCQAHGIAIGERDLTPDDVYEADEVLLVSTPYCILPVTRFNDRPIGDGRPGETFRRLLAGWGVAQGIDIAAQAKRFAHR